MNPTKTTGAPCGAPASPRYHITPTHHTICFDNERYSYWVVMFGDEIIDEYRAKSRSRSEMQRLLNHMNQKLTEAENLYATGMRKALV